MSPFPTRDSATQEGIVAYESRAGAGLTGLVLALCVRGSRRAEGEPAL